MLKIQSCSLPTGDAVYCGVTLEPYCVVRKGDQVVSLEEAPEEGSAADGVYQLRMRWYRSVIPRGGVVCSVHPEREASLQCLVCLRSRVAQHLSYHCSVECLKSHWHLHKDYHKQHQGSMTNGGEGKRGMVKEEGPGR